MTRRSALWLLFVAGGVLGIVLLAIDDRMWDEGGPGIVGFELAGSREDSRWILAEWGRDGRDAARLSLWLDFAYLVMYAAFWALAVRAARDAAALRGWRSLAGAGGRLWRLPIVAAAFDVAENVSLLVLLGDGGGSGLPFLASLFASVKFAALAVSIGYVALVVVRSLFVRSPRRFALGLTGLAVVGVAAVALNTWLVERATEPAKPDIGRILELPGGDIQVREDGDPGAPPVVLIHGYAVSMRWFDAVTPLLARELRVIRLDLLGHGGSEKPRDGYSMENQADIVAQAMRRLGVRRAALVGHSMGGIVATAFAERHRGMVSRVMMIGTAPDEDGIPVGFPVTLAFAPVTGHLLDTFVDRRLVRNAVEAGFAPEFDPPERLVNDPFDRTTWSAFNGTGDAIDRYWGERGLNERLARTGVPVTVVLGERETHTLRSLRLYNAVPRARTVLMQALDHSPHVEAPERTARLIAAFALGR